MITTVAGVYDTETILRAADAIQGWMAVPELRWLVEQARTRAHIVEVGAFQGRSTVALSLASPGYVTSVDTWVGEPDAPEYQGSALLQQWSANVTKRRRNGTWFTGTLADYADRIGKFPESPDFIFIDGAHDVVSVTEDCRIAKWLIRKGGLVAGHDWQHPGLSDAVRKVFPNAVCVVDRIWAVPPDEQWNTGTIGAHEFAVATSTDPRTVRRLLGRGVIAGFKSDGQWRIQRSEIDRAVQP